MDEPRKMNSEHAIDEVVPKQEEDGVDAAAAQSVPNSSLPMRKRRKTLESANEDQNDPKSIMLSINDHDGGGYEKQMSSISNFDDESDDESEKQKESEENLESPQVDDSEVGALDDSANKKAAIKSPPTGKAREIRLEQNRKAARESRRRKKMMIEELQRSVIFFSKRNASLKKENEDLTRMLLQAQAHVQAQAQAHIQAQQQQQQQQHSNGSGAPGSSQQISQGHQIKSEGGQQQLRTSADQGQGGGLQQQIFDTQNALAAQMQAAAQHGQTHHHQHSMNGNASNGGQNLSIGESVSGQPGAKSLGPGTSNLQAAALQAVAAARNMFPQLAMDGSNPSMFGHHLSAAQSGNFLGGGVGDASSSALQLQQLQQLQAGQQFMPMQAFAGQQSAMMGGASGYIPFYSGLAPQQFMSFAGSAPAPAMGQQQQSQQQQQQSL